MSRQLDVSEYDEEEDEWYPRMPKSALRLQDTRSPAPTVRTKYIVRQGAPPLIRRRASLTQPQDKKTETLPRRRFHPLVFVGIGLFIMVAGYVALTSIASLWTNTQEQWQYGYPRTAQYDEVVGHYDSEAHPSHFIAVNVNGQVEIIEFPGGDASHARIYTGFDVLGQNASLSPVTLSFQDVNGDGKLDMIVTVGNSHLIFLNEQVKGVWQFVKSQNP